MGRRKRLQEVPSSLPASFALLFTNLNSRGARSPCPSNQLEFYNTQALFIVKIDINIIDIIDIINVIAD